MHGGIRYLEHGQLHLVRESIRERQILLRIAPHLVQPLAFTWPIYQGARVGKVKLTAGLLLYQLMALGKSRKYSSLDAAATLAREPSLGATGLRGGAVYYDARTDDARLTIANALAADQNGAFVASHTRVTQIIRDAGKAVGAVVIAQLWRKALLARGRPALDAAIAAIAPWSIAALLATLIMLFAFQGEAILRQPLVIAMLAVPILLPPQDDGLSRAGGDSRY